MVILFGRMAKEMISIGGDGVSAEADRPRSHDAARAVPLGTHPRHLCGGISKFVEWFRGYSRI